MMKRLLNWFTTLHSLLILVCGVLLGHAAFAETDRISEPDDFGYIYIDSQEPGGPQFNWVEHTANATTLTDSDFTNVDNGYSREAIRLPFSFPLYEFSYDSLYLSTNGYVSFGRGAGGSPTGELPYSSFAGIFFWGANLTIGNAGTRIRYESFSSPQRFVITCDSLSARNDSTQRISTQLILYPDRQIIVQYRNRSITTDAYAIGIQSLNGRYFLNYSRSHYATNTTIKFTVPCYQTRLESPANHSVQVPITSQLRFQPGSCAINFDLYLGIDSTAVRTMSLAARVATGLTGNTWSPMIEFQPDRIYYWRVLSRNSTDSVASRMWSFRTFSSPLSGTYTIGGMNPDFTTLHEAMNLLQGAGVADGGVNFRMRSGTYRDSTLTFSMPNQANRPIRIGLYPNATVNLEFNNALNLYNVLYLHSPHVTIDGSWPNDSLSRHLSIRYLRNFNFLSTQGSLICLPNGSHHATLKNCSLTSSVQSTMYTLPGRNVMIGNEYRTGEPDSLINCVTIANCEITGGSKGIYTNAYREIDSLTVRNCEIHNFTDAGIYARSIRNSHIINNRIFGYYPPTLSDVYAIKADYWKSCRVEANQIGPFEPGSYSNVTGIDIYTADSCAFVNNMISLNIEGLMGIRSNTHFNSRNQYLFNTISMSGVDNNLNTFIVGFALNKVNRDTITNEDLVFGNIIQVIRQNLRSPSSFYAFTCNSGYSRIRSDYNLFSVGSDSTTDNRYIAQIRQPDLSYANYNSLRDLQASSWAPNDMHSVSEIVPFVSDSNLHIRNNVPTLVESGAVPHRLVPTDIDGDARGIARCDIGADEGTFLVSVNEVSAELPTEFALQQNYPNPFNSTTNISFDLPVNTRVTLVLYNALGQQVHTLIGNEQYRAGRYNVTMNSARLSSGVYFVQMRTAEFRAERKCVILK